MVSQPTSHTTQHAASTEENDADEGGFSATLSVGVVTVSPPNSPTSKHQASTEDNADDILDSARIARNFSFPDPIRQIQLSLPRISAFSAESSKAIECILITADKPKPTVPEAHGHIGLHVATSSITKAVSEIIGEVTSHTAPPESSISQQREINLITEVPGENALNVK